MKPLRSPSLLWYREEVGMFWDHFIARLYFGFRCIPAPRQDRSKTGLWVAQSILHEAYTGWGLFNLPPLSDLSLVLIRLLCPRSTLLRGRGNQGNLDSAD